MKVKQCGNCKKMLSEDQFYVRTKSSGYIGLDSECKKCGIIGAQKWNQQHRERVNASGRKYYLKNRDERSVYSQKRYAENHVKIDKQHKEWNKNNPEKIKQYQKKWRAKNSEKNKLTMITVNARYRSKKANALGKFTAVQWKYLLDFYGLQCMMCGEGRNLEMDHVIPISKGGMHSIENIQILCRSCNSHKGNKTMDFRKIFTHPI